MVNGGEASQIMFLNEFLRDILVNNRVEQNSLRTLSLDLKHFHGRYAEAWMSIGEAISAKLKVDDLDHIVALRSCPRKQFAISDTALKLVQVYTLRKFAFPKTDVISGSVL